MTTRILSPAVLALAAGVVSACSTARSAPADDREPAVAVRVEPAASITRPALVTASGVVDARTSVDVAFQLAGKVVEVGPDEGSTVRAGQLLAQVDPTDYRLGLEQAGAQAEHAVSDRERHRPLLAAGSIAASDYERLTSAARQATAAEGLARKRLADTRLVAPLSGVVARRAVEPGETVSPGQAVFTLVAVDPVKVRIGVPEADVASVRDGQPAEVRLPALGDQAFAGRVTLVGIAADPTTRTYAVEISVPNPAHTLKVGMVAEARVRGDRLTRAITVPAGSVVRDADGATLLYVLDAGQRRVHTRPVELGAALDDDVEVVRGLAPGETVVVAGQQRVRDGSRVLVTPAAAHTTPEPAAAVSVGGAQ
jgi:membrane fusion protein (multidrug efflux system)